jgi:replicative DNA helicase
MTGSSHAARSWPSTAHDAQQQESASIWRWCIGVAQWFAETAYHAVGNPAEAMSAAIQRIVDIRRSQDADLVAPTEWAERTWQDLHTGTTRILAGLPSGLHELDLATLGLVASELYVLAARTSIGKTTLSTPAAIQRPNVQAAALSAVLRLPGLVASRFAMTLPM